MKNVKGKFWLPSSCKALAHTHTNHTCVSLHRCSNIWYNTFTHNWVCTCIDLLWSNIVELLVLHLSHRYGMLVWICVYMFVFLVFWTWTWSHMIPYWVPVISVTHSLGFESKRCSYATLHSHSLNRFRRCFPRWFLNIFTKFFSLCCAYGSHDS